MGEQRVLLPRTLGGYLYRGKDWGSTGIQNGFGRIEHVATTTFCDAGTCARLAVWRIEYGAQSLEFCSRHAIAAMRDRRYCLGRQ